MNLSLVLFAILASAVHGAFAFTTTSNGCVTCVTNAKAEDCTSVFVSLITAAHGKSISVNTLTEGGFCCAETTNTCANFAANTGLSDQTESCDSSCASAFSSSSPDSPPTAAAPTPPEDTPPTDGDSFSCTNCTYENPAAPQTAPSPPDLGSTPPTPSTENETIPAGSYSNPVYESFCSTYFSIMNNTEIDTGHTVTSVLTSASSSVIAGPTQCCGWCLATEACVGWVYNNVTATNCFLKTGSSPDPPTNPSPDVVQAGYLRKIDRQTPDVTAFAMNIIAD